jgi:flagellar FliL protein
LSAKNYKEMMDPIGKQRLRDEIVMRANQYATKGKVTKVYFTEFIIQ